MGRWKKEVVSCFGLIEYAAPAPPLPAPSKMNGAREKTPGDTPVMLILVYFESLLEIESMIWSTITLPSRRAPDNLNDAELSSNKGLLMYQCACIVRVYVHANKHSLSVSLAFDLQAGEVWTEAHCVTTVSHLGGKLQALFRELALLASDSDSCSQRTASCIMQSHCHHEPSWGEAQWKKWRGSKSGSSTSEGAGCVFCLVLELL